MGKLSQGKYLMGTFSLDAKDFVEASLWLERVAELGLEGRNAIPRICVKIVADMWRESKQAEDMPELTYEKANEYIDRVFPVKNYRGGSRIRVENIDREKIVKKINEDGIDSKYIGIFGEIMYKEKIEKYGKGKELKEELAKALRNIGIKVEEI